MKKFGNSLNTGLALLVGFVILCTLIKEKVFGKHKNEIKIAGHRVNSKPCIGALNDLFGQGVDSIKACECFIPQYFDVIKNDAETVEKLYEGIIDLEGEKKDSLGKLLKDCVTTNILDTNYKPDLERFRTVFIKQFNDSLEANPDLIDKVSADSFCNCVIQHLNGRITIKQFYSNSYYDTDSTQEVINNCMRQSIKMNK
jgi:hypothetical protein